MNVAFFSFLRLEKSIKVSFVNFIDNNNLFNKLKFIYLNRTFR